MVLFKKKKKQSGKFGIHVGQIKIGEPRTEVMKLPPQGYNPCNKIIFLICHIVCDDHKQTVLALKAKCLNILAGFTESMCLIHQHAQPRVQV